MAEMSVAEKMASMIPDLTYIEMKVLSDLIIGQMIKCENTRRESIENVLRRVLEVSINAIEC